jgi:putative transposase
MAESQSMTTDEVVARLLSEDHVDLIRGSLRWVVQQMMEAEVTELIGAGRGERTSNRATHRNGYRQRRWTPAPACGPLRAASPQSRRR